MRQEAVFHLSLSLLKTALTMQEFVFENEILFEEFVFFHV